MMLFDGYHDSKDDSLMREAKTKRRLHVNSKACGANDKVLPSCHNFSAPEIVSNGQFHKNKSFPPSNACCQLHSVK